MTAETDKAALREGVAETLWDQSYAYLRDAPWDGALVIARDIPDGRTADAVKAVYAQADELLAGPLAPVLAQAEADRAALEKINGIRNSIIGLQTMNWSEHIYPLVAALDAAGIEGADYPEARENYGTMLERTNAAEARTDRLAAEVETLTSRLDAQVAENGCQVARTHEMRRARDHAIANASDERQISSSWTDRAMRQADTIIALRELINAALAEIALAEADERDGSATERTRHARLAGIRGALTGVGSAATRAALARAADKPGERTE